MSRIATTDQILVDRLGLNDTDAFEELYRHYWHGLYIYCLKKLQSPEDAKKIVRIIFVELWEHRHSIPVSFSLSGHLYGEVRKMVVKALSEKLEDTTNQVFIEKRLTNELSVKSLQAARQPVTSRYAVINRTSELIRQQTGRRDRTEHSAFGTFKWMVHSLTAMLPLNNLSYPKN